MRCWRGCAARAIARYPNAIVTCAAQRVGEMEAKTRAALPVWRSCITNESIDEPAALKLLCGKNAAIVKAHNDLYDRLYDFAQCFKSIELVPELESNALSKQDISVARTTLGECKGCSILAQGMDILAVKDQHGGIRAAKAFVEKNAEPYSHLPPPFWRELKTCAEYAPTLAQTPTKRVSSAVSTSSSTSPAPKAKAVVCKTEGTAVKTEQAAEGLPSGSLMAVKTEIGSSGAPTVRRGLKRNR